MGRGIVSVFALLAWILSGTGCITLDQIVLRPSLEFRKVPSDWGYVFEEVTLPIGDDRSIVVWHIPATDPKALIIIIPGMSHNKERYLEALPLWNPDGYSIVLMDFEGFGDSPGTPSLSAAIEDAGVALDYAKTLHDYVFAYSVSFGTPVLAYHAGQKDLVGCIFEGTLIMLEEPTLWLVDHGFGAFGEWLGGLAGFWMTPQIPAEYDIVETMAMVDEPKLFLHSIEDNLTSLDGAYRLFDIAPEPKEFIEMRGEHGEMIRIDFDTYSANQIEWLDQTLARHIENH